MSTNDSCENDGDSADDREAFGAVTFAQGGERAMEVEGGEDEVGIVDVGVDCEVKASEANGDCKTERELLEKMMKENEKMMGMMSQLFERSETQTRTLNALTHRVEMLEKAFVCDRLRRKKKKAAPFIEN